MRPRALAVVACLWAALAAPLVVALAALRSVRWFPILDLAMTELRVRDVASAHPPLVGLAGRIGTLTRQGSHPGPVSFWVLWPVYQLAGARAWGLQVATVSLHLVAVGLALWIATRRAGWVLTLGLAAVLAVLLRAYGPAMLTEPWNPYLPLTWWLVFLLAVWSVVCGDVVLLPVAAFAGSFCAQTHIPYVGPVAGLGLLAAAAAAVPALRRSGDRASRRKAARWSGIAAAVTLVLWAPPIIQQVTGSPGNMSVIWEHFTGATPEPAIGVRLGLDQLLLHLDPRALMGSLGSTTGSLVNPSQVTAGSVVPGRVLLAVWAAAAVLAWRARQAALVRLHLVLAVALVLAAASMSRIFGQVWFYLTLWAWGITALVIVAVGWTLVALLAPLLARRVEDRGRARAAAAGALALAAVTLVSTVAFAVDAAGARPPAARLSSVLGRLVPPTVSALRGDAAADRRPDARYLVTWTDAAYIGSQGYGLLDELERSGLRVGVRSTAAVPATTRRVMDPSRATAEVRLVTGVYIERTRAVAGLTEVASFDPRSAAERAQFERLRGEVIDELRRSGHDDFVPVVDENLFGAAIDTRLPSRARARMEVMLRLGVPTAVFTGPPGLGTPGT